MEKFDPIDIEFLINSEEVKEDARKVREEIHGVGEEAERASAKAGNKSSSSAAEINKVGKATASANKDLMNHERILRQVKDEYKGIVDDGIETFNALSREQQVTVSRLVNTDEAIQQISKAQKQLNVDFAAGKMRAVEFTQAQGALAAQEAKLRNEAKALGAELKNLGSNPGVQIQKRQFDGLGNSINQISRELPAFTYSAQTGFMAISNNIPILADEIARLKAKNDELIASGQKAVPVWKQVVKGLFSWGTALSLGVTLITIYGKEIGQWVTSLFKGKDALDAQKVSVDALNKAYESGNYQKVIKDMAELRSMITLAKDGLVDKKVALDKYNETMGTVYKKTDDLNEAERIMVEKAPAYIQAMLYKVAAAEAMNEAAKKLVANQKRINEIEDEITEVEERDERVDMAASRSGFVAADPKDKKLGRLNKELEDLEKEGKRITEKSQNIVDEFNKKAAEIAKSAGINVFGGDDKPKADRKIVDERKKLLDKIIQLDREYARKTLSRDEEEIQALRDKFTRVRELIEEFNKDPKNKNKIDVTGLGVIQENAEANLVYRQETKAIKEELERQKAKYEEIENFKARFGIEKTRERYGKELKEYDNYAAAIRQKIVNDYAAFAAVEDGTATPAQEERVKMLEQEQEREQFIAQQKYLKLLEDYRTYEEQRKLLYERYQEDYNKLILEKNFDEADERKKAYEEDLANLQDANLKKKDEYKSLFEDIGRMTIATGKTLIADAKKLLETQEMSAETRAKILKLIADTEKQITDLQVNNILDVAKAIKELGLSLNEIGTNIGNNSLRNLGSFLSSMANGVEDLIKSLKFDDSVEDIDKMTAALDSAIKLINMVTRAAAQRRAAEEEYYRSVLSFQNSYNLGLQEQIRLQSIISENAFLTDYEGRITDALAAINNANTEYQEALRELGRGQVQVGQRNRIDWGNVGSGAMQGAAAGAAIGSFVPLIGNLVGGIIGGIGGALAGLFGGMRREDVFGSLLGEYPELLQETEEGVLRVNSALAQSLLESGLLNAETEQILQNVLDWQTALDEARAQIRQVITDLTGSLSDDLRSALVDSFRSGEDAAIRMGETVEKVLENIISNLIFNRIFSDAFDRLEDSMAESFDVGGDGNWVDDFSRFFNQASGLTDDFNQALRDAQQQAARFGFDIFNPEEDETGARGLQGAIRRELTEETGSELTGLFRGQFDITKRHLQLHEQHFALEQQNFDVTRRIMQYSALIEQNTAATVEQLQLAVSELRVIKSNTGGQTARDLGL